MTALALLDESAAGLERRIQLALMAFAAGDAFGVAYEFLPEKAVVNLDSLSRRREDEDWPFGGVSDDTHLSILTILAVQPGDPKASAAIFLRRLREAIPTLRGLGPTTRAALGLAVEARDIDLIGTTNGGMMRTALLGLAYNENHRFARRAMVHALAGATHSDPTALCCAVLASSLFSHALDHDATTTPREVLRYESTELESVPEDVLDLLRDNEWQPPADGISLSPVATLGAVIWVVGRSRTIAETFRLSCELGGDTDTVAALSGGLVAARMNSLDLLDLPWIDDVMWSEIPQVTHSSRLLADMRAGR